MSKHRGRPPTYDWDKLSDGQVWVRYKGIDFQSEVASFRALVHRTASAKGLKVETSIDKNAESVTFRFYADAQH